MSRGWLSCVSTMHQQLVVCLLLAEHKLVVWRAASKAAYQKAGSGGCIHVLVSLSRSGKRALQISWKPLA